MGNTGGGDSSFNMFVLLGPHFKKKQVFLQVDDVCIQKDQKYLEVFEFNYEAELSNKNVFCHSNHLSK